MDASMYDDLTVSRIGQRMDDDPWGTGATNSPQKTQDPWKNSSETPIVPVESVEPRTTSFVQTSPIDLDIPQDRIKIQVAPEKGGMVWKHVNYIVSSQLRKSSSLRRFSDFVTLYDTLYKRYPMRLIPHLPPKKVSPLTDEAFIEQRRRGLVRFINFIGNHPVLREDEDFLAFLKEQGDMASYKKRVPGNNAEEFDTAGNLTEQEVQNIPLDIESKVAKLKLALATMLEDYNVMCDSIEQVSSRLVASSEDYAKLSASLQKLSTAHDCVMGCQLCPQLANAMSRLNQGLSKVARITREHGQTSLDNMVENLRGYRDILQAMDDLLLRRERLISQVNLESIQKRIQGNKTKLDEMNQRGAVQRDVDKLAGTMDQDQRELVTQTRRLLFMRYCLWQEIRFLHKQKSQIGLMWQSWINEQSRYSESVQQEWFGLISITQDMPIVY